MNWSTSPQDDICYMFKDKSIRHILHNDHWSLSAEYAHEYLMSREKIAYINHAILHVN